MPSTTSLYPTPLSVAEEQRVTEAPAYHMYKDITGRICHTIASRYQIKRLLRGSRSRYLHPVLVHDFDVKSFLAELNKAIVA